MLDFEITTSFDEILQNVKETLRNYFIENHIKNVDQVSKVISVMIDNLKILVSSGESTQTTMEQLERVLKKHYKQKTVLIAERYNFFKRDQVHNESITSYVDELKKLATTCLFGVFLEEALRDRLVCGIKDESIQADLLSKKELTFDYAYQYASTMEKLAVESKQAEKVDRNKNKKKVKNKKKTVELDVGTAEELHHSIDIKEELQPFEFEASEEIDALKGELSDNLPLESVNQLFGCDKCEEQFTEKASLQKHLMSHTKQTKQHTCRFCGKTFPRSDTLVRHLKVHKDLKPFLCETCNECFSSNDSLRLHKQGHVTVEVSHTCQECGKEFPKRSKLYRHLKTHGEKQKFECEFCDRFFTRKSNLKLHLKKHAGKEEVLGRPISSNILGGENNDESKLDAALFICHVCKFTTEKKHNLRRHVNVHIGYKPFMCDVCDYRTTSNRYLQDHFRRHTGIKPFACEVCDYKSATKSAVKYHVETVHGGEKKYVCEFCAYKTNNSAVLRIHLRTHTGEKPFECKICNYKTSDRSTLRNHIRIHTGEKPYSCKLCDYRAAQRTGLVYHLKTHQKKKKVAQPENSLL